MNHTPPSDESIDRLLSEFLKAQLPQPWPAAPATAASEPSVLVADRAGAAEAPRNQPAPRDTTARSRFTLAASVALLLGTCWTLSNGFQAGDRPATGTNGNGPGISLNGTTADGKDGLPGAVAKEKDKTGNPPVKVDNPFGP
jgi:hypothetical protein